MDILDKRIINQLQGGFPLVTEPFAAVGLTLGLSAANLLQRLQALLAQGVISRFGPFYHADRLGGAAWLAAMAVPESELTSVIAQINAEPAVAHHYQREHTLNLWFVVAAETLADVTTAITRLEQVTGYPVYRLPKEREYGVELKLYVCETAGPPQPAPAPTVLRPPWPVLPPAQALSAVAQQVMRATLTGLPLCAQPYRAVATSLNLSESEVIATLAKLLAQGVIRRIGLAPNPVALGYRANAMAVWDVADTTVDAHGSALARLPWVSHCYRRPRCLPHWPYNLFVMLHAATRAEVTHQATQLRQQLGQDCAQATLLYSTRMLKKTGLRSPPRSEVAPCSA